MLEYTLPSPMTALEAVRHLYPESSRATLQKWLRLNRFTVDGALLSQEKAPLEAGQIVRSAEKMAPLTPKGGLQVLHVDRYLLAINKPVGLLSVPLDEPGEERHALGLLRQQYRSDQIFPVHRLDRECSGVLLFARGKESQEKFKNLFAAHDLQREYFAIVEGRVEENSGNWRSHLLELPSYRVVVAPASDETQEAITHFSVTRRSTKYTYLRLLLETGRKHQIRVQAAAAGHPIVGDRRYGSSENPLKRLALHAYHLGLIHPFTGQSLSFSVPLPRVFLVLGAKESPVH